MIAKPILALLFAGTCIASARPSADLTPAARAELEYRRGQAAESAHDPVAAKEAYTRALQYDPRHAHARYSLGQMKFKSAAMAAKGRETRFSAQPVAEFRVLESSLHEALMLLSKQIAASSGKDAAPDFIIEDPAGKLTSASVTLDLKGVPAGGVLRYVLDQARAKARYDEHAIVILPK